jgi:ATP-dependent RNA helicase DeaD
LPGWKEEEAPSASPGGDDGAAPSARGEERELPGFVQLFVNVGKREGLRPSDLQTMLTDKGIATEDTGRIRVRDRMTFISVRKEVLDRVVTALTGQVVGGRAVVAELARGRG